MKLSQHFNLKEFTRSDTAKSKGIDNSPSTEVIVRLTALCHNVLEPLRRWAKEPVTISSGYRSKALNRAVGGVANSQHMTGEAADIQVPTTNRAGKKLTSQERLTMLRAWYDHLKQLPHDQLIWETKGSTRWIHVSCCLDTSQNRSMTM